MVEVHHDPDHALSDGMQSLFPDQFDALMEQVRQIAAVLGGTIPLPNTAERAGKSGQSHFRDDKKKKKKPQHNNVLVIYMCFLYLLSGLQ